MSRIFALISSLLIFQSAGALALEIEADLMAALHPPGVVNESRIASQILTQFGSHQLTAILSEYAIGQNSIASRRIAARALALSVEKEDGDRGLVQLLKNRSDLIVKKAAAHIAERISILSIQNLPMPYRTMTLSDKRSLVSVILEQTDTGDAVSIKAASKLLSFSDAQLVLKSYAGGKNGKELAASVLTKIAEDQGGVDKLIALAIGKELPDHFGWAALKRIRDILSVSGGFNKFKKLGREQKEALAYKFLLSAQVNELGEVSRIVSLLDSDGDMIPILRAFAVTTRGIQIAATAIVSLSLDGSSEAMKDHTLLKFMDDSSPFVSRIAVSKIKNRLTKSGQPPAPYRLLEVASKQKLVKKILDETVASEADQNLAAHAIIKLSQSSETEMKIILRRYQGAAPGRAVAESLLQNGFRRAAFSEDVVTLAPEARR